MNFLAAEVAVQAVRGCSLAVLARLLSVAGAHPGSRLRKRRDKVTTLIPSVIIQVITQCTHVGSKISGRT
jgi:UDP-glucose 4-epimerase